MSLTIKLAEEELILLPERGLFWARESMLLVADWHVGKAAAFRTAGIGVPDGDLDEEFARLESMATVTGADSLVILGDFVHAREGLTPDLAREVGLVHQGGDDAALAPLGDSTRLAHARRPGAVLELCRHPA